MPAAQDSRNKSIHIAPTDLGVYYLLINYLALCYLIRVVAAGYVKEFFECFDPSLVQLGRKRYADVAEVPRLASVTGDVYFVWRITKYKPIFV